MAHTDVSSTGRCFCFSARDSIAWSICCSSAITSSNSFFVCCTDANHYKDACANPLIAQTNAVAMAYKTDLFEIYSEQIPGNDDGYKAAKSLNEIAQGLTRRYDIPPVPPLFCKLKYSSIESSAKVIQHTLGNRPR